MLGMTTIERRVRRANQNILGYRGACGKVQGIDIVLGLQECVIGSDAAGVAIRGIPLLKRDIVIGSKRGSLPAD